MKTIRHFLLLPGITLLALFSGSCTKEQPGSGNTAGNGHPAASYISSSCDDEEVRSAEVYAHQLTATQADNMIANYCTAYNVSFPGFKTLSLSAIAGKLATADCEKDIVVLYGSENGDNASIQFDIVPADNLPTNATVLYCYPIALLRGIIDQYGDEGIQDFQFAYGLKADLKATILFRVRNTANGVVYLADYSQDPPTL